ncbi:hypothetical protein CYY_004817 [Polysphondylium violaceum]|uniref:Carbohydrate binding domain-containing protein n=1 Tax=Polysphondylium violaceum TaxID=133409 RepID=A0A8J4PVV2_9MYCE|nr:hypothetical protein CYY_004817 [Polysphondylium violaceum]
MFFKKFLFVAVAFAIIACALGENQLTMTQHQASAWEDGGQGFSVWEVIITNVCGKTIKDVTIVGESNFNLRNGTGDLWNLELEASSANRFHLPSYVKEHGLAHNTSHSFGYINKGYQNAQFSYCNIQY